MPSLAAPTSREPDDDDGTNVWSIWYAARFGKVERVCFLLERKMHTGALSIDAKEPVRQR